MDFDCEYTHSHNTGHQIITAFVPVYVCAVVVINQVNGVFRTLFSNPLKRIISCKEESVKERGREGGREGGREEGREGGMIVHCNNSYSLP